MVGFFFPCTKGNSYQRSNNWLLKVRKMRCFHWEKLISTFNLQLSMWWVFCSYRFWTATQKRKKLHGFTPFQKSFNNASLFVYCQDDRYGICHPLVPGWGLLPGQEVITEVEESPFGSAVMLQGDWEEERHSKQSLALWKMNVWDPQDNLVLYLQKHNWCL